MKIEASMLESTLVRLEPITADHREEMRELLDCDPDIWDIYLVSGYRDHFSAFWDMMLNTADRITYGVRDKANGRLAGTSSLAHIDTAHRTLEVGYTWYAPEYRGTFVNPETKLLMVGQAFSSGALRVQFGVDTRNKRSLAAMSKFATREGVIRRHKVTWTGYKRDTALFSIIDTEWDEVQKVLLRQARARNPHPPRLTPSERRRTIVRR